MVQVVVVLDVVLWLDEMLYIEVNDVRDDLVRIIILEDDDEVVELDEQEETPQTQYDEMDELVRLVI